MNRLETGSSEFDSLNLLVGSLVWEGKLHNNLSMGCQDACHTTIGHDFKVTILCDGCSMTDHVITQNQVGAILGAQYIANCIATNLEKSEGDIDDSLFNEILINTVFDTHNAFRQIGNIFRLADDCSKWTRFVYNKLMFTVVGLVVYNNHYWIFGLGDGCYGIDTKVIVIPPSSNFLNQSMVEEKTSIDTQLGIYESGSISDIETIWIASDGMSHLLSDESGKTDFQLFLSDDLTANRNKYDEDTTIQAFRRKLLRKHPRRFSDDVAFAIVRNVNRRTDRITTENID